MATGTTVAAFESFWGHPAPYSTAELNMWLMLHGYDHGVGFKWNGSEPFNPRTMVILTEYALEGRPCILHVKSMTGRPEGHAVYWDGYRVLDPNPDVEDLDITAYQIEEIHPVVKIPGIQEGAIFDLWTIRQVVSCNDSFPLLDASLMYEDDLPKDISQGEYDLWFEQSRIVDGVRMGPRFYRSTEERTKT